MLPALYRKHVHEVSLILQQIFPESLNDHQERHNENGTDQHRVQKDQNDARHACGKIRALIEGAQPENQPADARQDDQRQIKNAQGSARGFKFIRNEFL